MSGETGYPGPHERAQPSGRRNPDGTRIDMEETSPDRDADERRAVLTTVVKNEPGVTAKVTGLFARRQVNIERIVGEPMGDGTRSRITFVVEPPHPGVDQVKKQLKKLLPIISVEELDLEAAEELTASVEDS